MAKFGMLIFMLLPLLGNVYVLWHVWRILPFPSWAKVVVVTLMVFAFLLLFVGFSRHVHLSMPLATAVYEIGTSWLIILLYLFMTFLLLDIGRWVHLVPATFLKNSWSGTFAVTAFMFIIFLYGNIHYHQKVRQPLMLTTGKTLSRKMKVVMLSDLHLGYHNRRSEFAKWVDKINEEKADLILVAGDIIDKNIQPLEEQEMHQEFLRLNAPVVACLGNHEYYGGESNALLFYKKADITLLRDSVTTVGDAAFLYDEDLTQVNLGGRVTELNDFLLAGTSLNNGLNLNGIQRIGDYALYNVSTMSVVELPATMTWLGSYAMAGMTGMTALTCNAIEVPELGTDVWAGVNQKAIPLTVPAESKERYQVADQWRDFLYEISWLRGDVNNDGEVNIADVNTLIDIILGGKFDDMTMLRADVNGDGEIGIADINEVQDIILSAGSHAPAIIDTDNQLHIDDVDLHPGEQRSINVAVDQASAYSALQCDLMLPQGLSLVEVRSAQGHKIERRDVDGATTRMLLYSMDKEPLDEVAVLQFIVRADDALAAESQITLNNIVLADDYNTGWHLADCTARVTNSSGIEDLNADSDRLWVEGHTLCIQSRNDGEAQVVAVNGTSRNISVTDGVTRYQMESGYYVVVLNGKSHKIAIR